MARLGDVCEILDSRRIPITASDRVSGPYPYYGANGIQDHVADYLFDDELILLAEDGGNFGSMDRPIAYRVSGKCWVNNHAHVLKPRAGYDIDYVCYSLMYYDVSNLVNGATRQKLTQADMREMVIPDRTLAEQQHISAVLGKLNGLIRLRKQQLAKLEELVKARFVEMFGECERRAFIGTVTAISRGASPRPISEFVTDDPDGVNWIKIGDVSKNALYIEHTDEKITLEGAKKSRYVHKGDFILSNSMSFGRPYILNIDGCVHDGWLIISDYSSTFLPLYLYYAIRDDEVQKQFSGKVNGATVKNLNSDLVKNTLIKIPTMELQHQFSEYALKVEDMKLTIQQSLDKLEMLRKSLMQEYFG